MRVSTFLLTASQTGVTFRQEHVDSPPGHQAPRRTPPSPQKMILRPTPVLINSFGHQLFLVSCLLLSPEKPSLGQCQSFLQVLILLLLLLSRLGGDVLTFCQPRSVIRLTRSSHSEHSTRCCLFFRENTLPLRKANNSAILSSVARKDFSFANLF